MDKISTIEWKPFIVGDLFDIHPTKAYKMTNAQLMDNGNNPIVVNSSYNNGIGGYTTQEVTEKGGIITFSDTTTANAIFYQPNDFVGYPHIQGMYPKGAYAEEWQEKQLLFFVVTFKKAATLREFNYAYKFTREIASAMTVLLPVNSYGDPDWIYMDSYMTNIMNKSEYSLQSLSNSDKNKTDIDTSNWKPFNIGSLFTISRPIARNQSKYIDGNIPFVASGSLNNGVVKYFEKLNNEQLDEKNCITVSPLDGSAFYQPYDFLGRGGAGSAILLLRNQYLNENNGLFIATAIRSSLTKYTYSDQLNSSTISNETIMLPVDSYGDPDWKYMDSYMIHFMKKSETYYNTLVRELYS